MSCYQCITTFLVVYVCAFVTLLPLSFQNAIYLFNTEDNNGVEYYDCLYLQAIPYCQRLGFPSDLRRHNQTSICHNNGKLWLFDKLRTGNVTLNQILHGYRSSIEKVEEYALYLAGHVSSGFLCQCQTRSFGKNCEYQLISDIWHETFDESRKWQNDYKQSYRLEMQAYGKTLCYTTLTCDYGLLCLDWRDICDGRQQCMNGTDEEACDLLEFNECEKDEYRCSNGMCIPDIYFLDHDYDCMDYSDERSPFGHKDCAHQADPLNCDEHICGITEWSCGDGQCIDEKSRYEWQEDGTTLNTQCHSMREYLYMCELNNQYKLWTAADGRCYYSSTIYLLQEKWNEQNQTSEEYCVYLVKCVLSNGVQRNCSCNESTCELYIRENCPSTIQYPSKGLLTPYLISFYNKDRQWYEKKQPDFYNMSGSIKCSGYHARTDLNKSIQLKNIIEKTHIMLASTFCLHNYILKDLTGHQFHPSCYAKISHTLGKNLPYAFIDVCKRCISQYRINDGTKDCPNGKDEKEQKTSTCIDPVRPHRFQCFSNKETCLPVNTLGNSITDCIHGDDEFSFGKSLSQTKCNYLQDEECPFLRDYIMKSTIHINNDTQMITEAKISFRSYCNTFWDLKDKSDESEKVCRSWICPQNEYQCRNGQCISKHYVCDGEWDCFDASDELFDFDHLSDHNQLIDLSKEKNRCITMKSNETQVFKGFCNISREYPCLLINFTQPSDILHTRPCINISQIGDNKVDCLGGLDERNTLTQFNGMHQLGFNFQCRSSPNLNIDEQNLCASTNRCSNRQDDLPLCGNRSKDCSNLKNFLCIDGTCEPNARCDGRIQCQHGEDEYWCNPNKAQTNSKEYRTSKQLKEMNVNKIIELPTNPSKITGIPIIIENNQKHIIKRDSPFIPENKFEQNALICNRGVAVLHHTNSVICFCPPSYYGEQCEYHSDRLTSYVHLNVSHTIYAQSTTNTNIAIKVLILLMYESQIIDHQHFDFRPARDAFRILKNIHYLIYSRELKLLEKKIRRNWNRSSIIEHFPYSLQYEGYELKNNSEIKLVGVWRYPIFFDFLPSFRLAKTLRFLDKQPDPAQSPCRSNPCHSSNAECHILQNDPTNYVCLCKSGYLGKHCETLDQYCANNFCHSNSLCKSTSLDITADSRLPLCLCSLDRYGTRCGLVYDQCQSNPCKNNGNCYPSTNDMTQYACVCHNDYYGDQCQHKKEAIRLFINKNNVSGVSVIQYFYIKFITLELMIAHQEVLDQPSHYLHYQFANTYAPQIVLLKNYPDEKIFYPKIFFLSLTINEITINSSVNLTDENMCMNVKDMVESISVYEYHKICRNHSSSVQPLCFFDNQYLCLCQLNKNRAECFGYDHKLDECNHCLFQGRCVRGDLEKEKEFICICTKCRYGHRCQFSLQAFGFTLDSLLVDCSYVMKIIYTAITFLLVVIGVFNNFCSFITFKRPSPKKTSVGNLLFIVSCINPMVLLVLFIKFIQITFNVSDIWSCKMFSYLLSVLTRSTYWMTSWITVSRFLIILFPTSLAFKNHHQAIKISIVTIIILFGIHVHEFVYYTSIQHTSTDVSICVTDFNSNSMSTFNRVTTLIHYLVPFSIQMICITFLIVLATRSRVKTVGEKMAFHQMLNKQFRMHKEHYIMPVIIILSALPQTIITFSVSCTELSAIWRHILLVSYLFSYSPQLLGFILYVLPSTTYKAEFNKTSFVEKFYKRIFNKNKNDIIIQNTPKMQTNLEGTI